MKFTKLTIKRFLGLKEFSIDGRSAELTGNNGTGKTTVLDAVKMAFRNRIDRDVIIKQGESESEILVECDSGLSIHRKFRAEKADYKSIKQNGKDIPNPEYALRDIFTELQLNPVEFLAMTKQEQNRIILDLIEFDWDINWIKQQFGGDIPDVNYEQNILGVLHDIQSEDGDYFLTRQDINRDIRNNLAFIEEIGKTLPEGYTAENWRSASLADVYKEIERRRHVNARIEKAKGIIKNKDNQVRAFQAEKEIAIAAIDRQTNVERERLEKEVIKLEQMLKDAKARLGSIETEKQSKISEVEKDYKVNVSEFEAQVKEYSDVANQVPENLAELENHARNTEEMKGMIREYDRMVLLQQEVEEQKKKSDALTAKIEHARALPGIILQTAKIPIKNLTVKDGIPLINGLPVSNLSEGEKLDLCIDIAIRDGNKLNILLLDGIEKLSDTNRAALYGKLREKGVHFLATRTTTENELHVAYI